MNPGNNNQSTFQADTNAINQAASEIVQDFGRDSAIGQSYLKLAEAAENPNAAIERLLQCGEERQRQGQFFNHQH